MCVSLLATCCLVGGVCVCAPAGDLLVESCIGGVCVCVPAGDLMSCIGGV